MTFKPIRETDRKSFEKKPFVELSDATLRTRRNLLLASSIALILTIFDVQILSARTPLLIVSGLENSEILSIFLLLITYFSIAFLWSSWNEVMKWRLHLTVGHPQTNENQVALRILKVLDDEPQYHAGKLKNMIDHSFQQIISSRNSESEMPDHTVVSEWKHTINEDIKRIEYFEKWFWAYGKQQRLKFTLIDIGLPLIVSAIAVYQLVQ
ncbi:hypothetical protein [Shewanella woodyi]|uniref:hypothetical protein n=1 Tax=Shewanella woodyi TaxID=60961 RepID=UPI0007EBC01D|nr:hypothetical protein [Shewanella woodyi]